MGARGWGGVARAGGGGGRVHSSGASQAPDEHADVTIMEGPEGRHGGGEAGQRGVHGDTVIEYAVRDLGGGAVCSSSPAKNNAKYAHMHSTAHSTEQHSPAQHSTAQHSTAQHRAQHSSLPCFMKLPQLLIRWSSCHMHVGCQQA